MDSTVIATSLAAIAHDIGTEPIALKLALTAYLVALAIFIPISSWMADRWGARNVFRVAIVVFIAGLGRLRGLEFAADLRRCRGSCRAWAARMMTPVARLVLVRVTPRNQLVDAMAWLSIPGLIGPIVGPPVGGFLTTYLSWHWIFLINVPIGLIGIVLVSRFLPDFQRNEPRRMDFRGFVLAGIAFAGWVFGISVLTLPALPARVRLLRRWSSAPSLASIYLWHCPAHRVSAARPAAVPLSAVPQHGGRRHFFRLGHGRHAVPVSADAAARLRADAVRKRHRSPLPARSARSRPSSSPNGSSQRFGFRTTLVDRDLRHRARRRRAWASTRRGRPCC